MVNKKILLSLLVLTTVATVAASGTWAYFSDTKDSTGNTITASTLTLGSVGAATWTYTTAGQLAPGDTATGSIELTNTGSMPGFLYASVDVAPATALDPEDIALVNKLTTSMTSSAGTVTTNVGTDGKTYYRLGKLTTSTPITASVAEAVGTDLITQGGSAAVTVHFFLNQVDSYNNA